jgi:hypothetical protein
MNTSTPRTDAAELTEPYEIRALGFCVVHIDDARQLERELTEAREQRDTLAEALRSIKNELGVPQPEYPTPLANAVKIASEALQSLTLNEL